MMYKKSGMKYFTVVCICALSPLLFQTSMVGVGAEPVIGNIEQENLPVLQSVSEKDIQAAENRLKLPYMPSPDIGQLPYMPSPQIKSFAEPGADGPAVRIPGSEDTNGSVWITPEWEDMDDYQIVIPGSGDYDGYAEYKLLEQEE